MVVKISRKGPVMESASKSMTCYKCYEPGVRDKIEKWIAERGGVKVWVSRDLSNPGGECYTPVHMEDGQDYPPPHWRYGKTPHEIVTDIKRFKFVKEMKEVKRFHVAVRMGTQGLSMKCTDASTRRIRAACAKAGPDSTYRFDYSTQEAVIEVPVWEGSVMDEAEQILKAAVEKTLPVFEKGVNHNG